MGDPGEYDPYANSDLAAESSATFNKTSKPFGATAKRELNVNIYGADTPGPGRYDPVKEGCQQLGQPTLTEGHASAFRSGSSQRPMSDALKTPGVGTYDPDITSVKTAVNNSGASMNGKGDRFRPDPSMTEDVGPGAYDDDKIKSLANDAKEEAARSSKKKPAFGATSSQRVAPYSLAGTPAPGYYQPMSPRFVSPSRQLTDRKTPGSAQRPRSAPLGPSPKGTPTASPKSTPRKGKSPLGGTKSKA